MADAFDNLSEEDKADLRKRLDAMSKSAPKTPPATSKGPRVKFKKPDDPKDIPANTPEDGPSETPKDIALPEDEKESAPVEQQIVADDQKNDGLDRPEPAAEPVDEFNDVPIAEMDDEEQNVVDDDAIDDEEEQAWSDANFDFDQEDDAEEQEPFEPGDAKDNEATEEQGPPEDEQPRPQHDNDVADLLRAIVEKLEKIEERVEAVEALMVELPKIVDDLMRIH